MLLFSNKLLYHFQVLSIRLINAQRMQDESDSLRAGSILGIMTDQNFENLVSVWSKIRILTKAELF
jgi:hypothetical protein